MTLFLLLLALLVIVSTTVAVVSLLYYGVFYAPFVPTPMRVIRQVLEAAELRDGQKIYDLGCGDGRLLIAAVKLKKVRAIGYEVAWLVVAMAYLRKWLLCPGADVRIIRGNFFKADLGEADVVFCYLFPKIMHRLEKKFEAELKQGARVLSFSFPLSHWRPVKVLKTRPDKPKNFLIYVYQVPQTHE